MTNSAGQAIAALRELGTSGPLGPLGPEVVDALARGFGSAVGAPMLVTIGCLCLGLVGALRIRAISARVDVTPPARG